MASNEETLNKLEETKKTDDSSVQLTESNLENNESLSIEKDITDTGSLQNEKKKRPISVAVTGSLKRHTPVFFHKKRNSESNENIKQSASEMWNDVKTVFSRLSLKKKKGKSHFSIITNVFN